MARITTQIGRQKIEYPNLGYDVEDGGVDLNNALTAIFTLLSNNINAKWSGEITLQKLGDAGDDVDVAHNYGTALSELKLVFVISGTVQTAAQVSAKFTITQSSTDVINIANKDTVNTVTFQCYVYPTKLNVESSDLESAFLTTLATLTGAQQLTSKTLSQTLYLEESEPSTPTSGKLAVYASSKTLWLKDSDGNAKKVGSGGSGTKNYVKNSDAETSTSLDITYGGGVSAPTQAPSPLCGLKSFRLTGAVTAGGTTWWQWALDSIDPFDAGKPLMFSIKTSASVANAFKVSIYNITDSTEVVQTIINIPTGYYQAKGFFIPVSGKSYGVRITQLTNGTNTLDLDDVFVGPLTPQYGQSVTDWAAFTPTGAWTTNATYSGAWKRVGDEFVGYVSISLSGAPTGTLAINIPFGLQIDVSKITATTADTTVVGEGSILDSGTANYSLSVGCYRGDATRVYPYIRGAASTYLNDFGNVTPTLPVTFGNGDNVEILFRVPIVGWTSNVQMADRSVEEYASNSNSTNTATDTTSFMNGTIGGLIPNGATGTTYSRRVQFQSQIQPTDSIDLEIDHGIGQWTKYSNRLSSLMYQNATAYGLGMISVSGSKTQLDVNFSAGGYAASGATYGANGAPWSDLSTWRWRVRKVSGGGLVGFPVSTSNIVGMTDGSVAGQGMFGELIDVSSTTWVAASGTYTSSATFTAKTLTKGTWLVILNVANRDIINANVAIWVTDSSNAQLIPGLITRIPYQVGNGANDNQLTGLSMIVNLSSSITVDRFRCYNYDANSRTVTALFQAFRIR